MKQRGLEAHLCLLCDTFSSLIVKRATLLTGKPVEIGDICGNTDFTDYFLTLCIVLHSGNYASCKIPAEQPPPVYIGFTGHDGGLRGPGLSDWLRLRVWESPFCSRPQPGRGGFWCGADASDRGVCHQCQRSSGWQPHLHTVSKPLPTRTGTNCKTPLLLLSYPWGFQSKLPSLNILTTFLSSFCPVVFFPLFYSTLPVTISSATCIPLYILPFLVCSDSEAPSSSARLAPLQPLQ